MKQKDMIMLVIVGLFTAMISFVLSSVVFGSTHKNAKVQTAQTVTTDFPDIRNDKNYSVIFNKSALDPAQPVQLGDQNAQPFNGPAQ